MRKVQGNAFTAVNTNGKMKATIAEEVRIILGCGDIGQMVKQKDFQITMICDRKGFQMTGLSVESHTVYLTKTARGFCVADVTRNGTYKRVSKVVNSFDKLEKALAKHLLAKY